MKNLNTLIVITLLLFSLNSFAQLQVATLFHQGSSTDFYGLNALVEARNAAVSGDTIMLSAGEFTTTTINKTLTIIGVGHYPDTLPNGRILRTIINGGLNIGNGSSNSWIEGLYVTGVIQTAHSTPESNITISRCFANGFYIGSSANLNGLLIENNVFATTYSLYFPYPNTIYNGLIIRNNIFIGQVIFNISGSPTANTAIIENNYFASSANASFTGNSNIIIRNNIFRAAAGVTSCLLQNNLFNVADYSQTQYTSLFVNNYFDVPATAVFVGATSGQNFSYSADYHLLSPGTYLGFDGTEVGIYGGTHPYKERAIPSTPYVEVFDIGVQADATGQLPVNIKVKAQSF